MWLNEKTDWFCPHLRVAQERMTELANRLASSQAASIVSPLNERATRQAARELLLAQASDWPFILRTGTSPGYARGRIETHLSRFNRLYEQLVAGNVNSEQLDNLEKADNLFLELNASYWST